MTILGEYLTVKEMVTVERNCASLGVSTMELMESAGKSIADEIRARFKPGSKVTVWSGLSGNGGDGFVAARHLAAAGYKVQVNILGDPERITADNTAANYAALKKMRSSVELTVVKDSAYVPEVDADVVVDALIGTSMHGSLRSPIIEAVKSINGSGAYTVAVDVPTGVEADTGEHHGAKVDADLTVTFHKPKQGVKHNPGNWGEVTVANIGIPPEAEQFTGSGDVWAVQRRRDPDAHKGMFGSLLVVGGSETYSGAPALTAMAAYATGVDLVYAAVPAPAAAAVAGFSPSLITVKLPGERLTEHCIPQILDYLDRVDAVAVGPGLGRHPDTFKAFHSLFKAVTEAGKPMVIDADGLKAYAESRQRISTPVVFTPHGAEFNILTGVKPEGGFREKGAQVEAEARKLGAVILLKGEVDVISDGSSTRFNWTGNPGMTVGGTGDVLTGLTAGYLALGASPMAAASAAAYINGSAGDRVVERKGYHLLPEDLVAEAPGVIEHCLG